MIREKILKMIARRRPIVVQPSYVEWSNILEGATAVVIGGGTGIGRAIAEELKKAGCKVIICGRNKYDVVGMDSEIWDVGNISDISNRVDYIVRRYGKVDIVVNSQGILPESDLIQDFYNIDAADFEKVMKVNLESVFFICQAFCAYFEENGIKGHILNVCSTEGLKGGVVPYGLSKTALVGFTRGLGKRMAGRGITVNGIAPGATATSMLKMKDTEDLRKTYIPSERATLPVEIAKAALFLIGDTGNQMCGEVLVMDGGESLH